MVLLTLKDADTLHEQVSHINSIAIMRVVLLFALVFTFFKGAFAFNSPLGKCA
jgi:hypothetical protein